ncbi:hypothetical protein GJAV_G00207590 [Gymnothorax javanicus]|nr:hypothetical protein GJAV_G00207590 [Gymnothorax javanicus]
MYFKENILLWFLFQAASEVALSQLPLPKNVRVESENFCSVLHWSSVPATVPVAYGVQYHIDDVIGWKDVPSCSPTNETHCNFTSVASPPVNLSLRVRAQWANQTSDWSVTELFCAREQTRLGPPLVKLSPVPRGLLVQISDASPRLRPEYGNSLRFRLFYWEQSSHHKVDHDESSSSVTLDSLSAGGNYCVQVQYLLPRRKGDLSVPVCGIVPESEDSSRRTSLIVAGVVAVLSGMLICACLISIHRNYDLLKRMLQPAIGPPTHLFWFFERGEFDQLAQLNASTPVSAESVTYVIEEEEDKQPQRSPAYSSSSQESEDPFPVSAYPALASSQSDRQSLQP